MFFRAVARTIRDRKHRALRTRGALLGTLTAFLGAIWLHGEPGASFLASSSYLASSSGVIGVSLFVSALFLGGAVGWGAAVRGGAGQVRIAATGTFAAAVLAWWGWLVLSEVIGLLLWPGFLTLLLPAALLIGMVAVLAPAFIVLAVAWCVALQGVELLVGRRGEARPTRHVA